MPLYHDYLPEPRSNFFGISGITTNILLMTGQVDDLWKRNQSAVRLLHELAAADEVKLREGSLSICVFCSRGVAFNMCFSAPEALAKGR